MTELIPGSPRFVERLLADRIGLDVASVGQGLIVRGVETRMNQLGIRRPEDYERILLNHEDEAQALIEEVVIPESWFFRDDRPFAAFREFVRAGWIDGSRRDAISVLCLPCAAGEEPYSVAIALMELGVPRERFEIVAVDISVRAIRRAAAGLYGINAFRGVDPALRDAYFLPSQGRWLLSPAVRTAVRFEQGNILDPGLLGEHAGFDVVFCRNLLIYFDDVARSRAFANLDRLSAAEGLLFLGHADRPDPAGIGRFHPLADRGSFGFRKGVPVRPTTAPVPVARQPRATPVGLKPTRPAPVAAVVPPPAAPAAPAAPAGPRLAAVELPTVTADDALTRASVLADQGRYAEAIRLVRAHLGRGTLDAAAHFLLGIVQQAAGDRAAAEAELTKAVYLDPEHDEALLALALLARRRGDVAAEVLYRRRAERVLARKGRA